MSRMFRYNFISEMLGEDKEEILRFYTKNRIKRIKCFEAHGQPCARDTAKRNAELSKCDSHLCFIPRPRNMPLCRDEKENEKTNDN